MLIHGNSPAGQINILVVDKCSSVSRINHMGREEIETQGADEIEHITASFFRLQIKRRGQQSEWQIRAACPQKGKDGTIKAHQSDRAIMCANRSQGRPRKRVTVRCWRDLELNQHGLVSQCGQSLCEGGDGFLCVQQRRLAQPFSIDIADIQRLAREAP